MKEEIQKLSAGLRMALLGAAVVVAGSTMAFSKIIDIKSEDHPPVRLEVSEEPLKRDGNFTTSFAPVVKKVGPSVVKVYTTTDSKFTSLSPRGEDPFDNPLFRRFFGDRFQVPDRGQGHRGFEMPKQQGLGSGVVVTEDGYILTNNHVIENADEIRIQTQDGQEYTAKVIGSDPKTDIAVLKVKADGLPHLTLGDSDAIEVGDVVLAVGNPFGIGQTVTMGMVSATGRGNMGLDYEDFIQTDAAINPGNSGGALVDAEGRLIGINTAILSRTGANHGIGFAVPINLARYVMENVVEHGRVVRGFLGVMIQDLTPNLAKQFDAPSSRGALIADVTPDSPAEKAGMKPGDVVVKFNGEKIRDMQHFRLEVAQTIPGAETSVTVLRGGDEKQLTVKLDEFNDGQVAASGRPLHPETDETAGLKGVAVADLTDDRRKELDMPKNLKGALVMNVSPSSAAYEAGLRAGDVIVEINREKVNGAGDAIRLTRDLEADAILLRVFSRGGSRYLLVDESDVG